MPANRNTDFFIDDYVMRYSNFVPRLYNYCLSLGMQPDRIMPSRAFCSDENQGYPIILITKNFGTFPFSHGRVGGIVASDRHRPHAHHGKDAVIIHASHVGYEPESGEFGIYRRLQTEGHEHSTDCGALCSVLDWYRAEYEFARQHIKLGRDEAGETVIIDNQLLRDDRLEGLFLNLDNLVAADKGQCEPLRQLSTASVFRASRELVAAIGGDWGEGRSAIGERLHADLFYFRREPGAAAEASDLINRNLIGAMPGILTSRFPPLEAAKVNVQVEFDRTFRTIVREEAYAGKKVVYISGIHIDVSPREGQIFPLTKYVPWAAYIQNDSGEGYTLEQDELYGVLQQQSLDNPHKIDLTQAINSMKKEAEIRIRADGS
jgi:hypothetical protein